MHELAYAYQQLMVFQPFPSGQLSNGQVLAHQGAVSIGNGTHQGVRAASQQIAQLQGDALAPQTRAWLFTISFKFNSRMPLSPS